MVGLGVPVRTIARELGISHGSAALAERDKSLDPEMVRECQERIGGRMAYAADRFLSQSLDGIKSLGPYQAMLCSGIAFDKHVQGRLAASRSGGGNVLVQILVNIDQSARSAEVIDDIPSVVSDGR